MKSTIVTNFEDSLIYAQTIQNGLLPKKRHFKKFFSDYFVYYKPQDKISGDFYWLTSKEDTVYFALADCTGHGVSGAMLSVLGISLLNYVIQKNYNKVGEYLTELDKKWIETFNNDYHDMHFNNDWLEITIISYNYKTKVFQYACAGGEFIIQSNNTLQVYKGNKYPIGGWQIEHNRQYDTFELVLDANSRLYFFSDGIKHQFDEKNLKKFGRKKLMQLLASSQHHPLPMQLDFVDYVVETWKGANHQTDDISLIGLSFPY